MEEAKDDGKERKSWMDGEGRLEKSREQEGGKEMESEMEEGMENGERDREEERLGKERSVWRERTCGWKKAKMEFTDGGKWLKRNGVVGGNLERSEEMRRNSEYSRGG